MAHAHNRLIAGLWSRLRTTVGIRFTRFVGVALVSLATSEIALTLCNGVFHMTSTPAAIIAWFCGAVVSYVLSRWAWERRGKPDVLRETVPFWVISALVVVILTLATKFAYHAAAWLGLEGIRHVLFVDLVYLVANLGTFLMRFVLFHYVLFADRATAARAAATGPDAMPPGRTPQPVEAAHPVEPAHPVEAAHTAPRTAGPRTVAVESAAAAGNGKAAARRDHAQPASTVTRGAAPSPTPGE
jgi:putative flippase GtrA